MSRVTEEEIKRINELYQIYGTYAAVAREVGRAPGTVKRYVQVDFQKEENIELKPIDWDVLGAAPKIDIKKGDWAYDD